MGIYLDNSATTRQYDTVTEEMLRWMKEDYGNPSSLHKMGLTAEKAIRASRSSISHALGVSDAEVYFTGSGTESDNTALFGAAKAKQRQGNRVIVSTIEHPAVLEACKRLAGMGFLIDYLGVDSSGQIRLDELEQAIRSDTILVSVMTVNNELGTVEPIWDIGQLLRKKESILFHSDGVQGFGKLPLNLSQWQVDMFSISGHKIHGPKGTGALYIRKGLLMEPHLVGGGQERGFRSGTENTPGVVGFGKAAELMEFNREKRIQQLAEVRTYLLEGIRAEIRDVELNSPERIFTVSTEAEGPRSSPSILNMSFLGCKGEALLHFLEQEEIFVSTGAACSSKKKGSHVLNAVGFSEERVDSAIRFSFSEFNTVEEMDRVLVALKNTVVRMRSLKRR